MDVVIVESPAKAKTINKYLGQNYVVLASYGHVRDLPAKDGSVDTADDFAMKWELYGDKARQLKAIADELKGADRVILATDPDREGEAISWHLLEWLKGKRAVPKGGATRVTFNEITKSAILAAMERPRDIDMDLVDAYLARRALDYLVGFNLSPVLWRKLPGAKSAGRVQSVALRLVVDREREIESFINREYWTVEADMVSAAGAAFSARLSFWNGKKLTQFDLAGEQDARRAQADVQAGVYQISAVETKPATRNPFPPFTTSTLQQEASRKLGFTASHTMRVAQALYEEGAITYMRTDGVQMAGEAIAAARATIADKYGSGPDVLPERPRIYTTKAKNAQEAHEAIRPTDLGKAHHGSSDNARLYELIWKRTIASQMASARLERTAVDLAAADGKTQLRATGQVVLSPGFLAVYTETVEDRGDDADDDSRRLPRLTQGEGAQVKQATADQHFTEPPPRFSEASLVKRLEELGIGRPSTYASILQTLRDRLYVRIEKNRFYAEEKGRLVTAFLERFFEKYVSYDFTADLETRLDDVSAGDLNYKTVLAEFWKDFEPKTKEILELRPSDVTVALDEFLAPFLFPPKADGSDPRVCPTCGNGRLSMRTGKFGAFISCSNYPECRYTRQFGENADAGGATSGPVEIGTDPATGELITLRSGRFGAYIQRGEDGAKGDPKPPRASIPKDVTVAGPDDLEMALKLLSLPRDIGLHPESGDKITASIGRYGPYLAHAGKYARLTSTAEVFETGMNTAVVKLAEAAANPGRARNAPAALRELGAHPVSGAAIKLMSGRFGPYITDGSTNANVPKGSDGLVLSFDEAVALIDARAAAGPAKGKRKVVKKAAVKKPAAKKPAPKKPAPKKPVAKKKAPAKKAAKPAA